MEDKTIGYCNHCNQMTNHQPRCMKCKPKLYTQSELDKAVKKTEKDEQ